MGCVVWVVRTNDTPSPPFCSIIVLERLFIMSIFSVIERIIL